MTGQPVATPADPPGDVVDTYVSTTDLDATGRPAAVDAVVSAPIVAALERAWAAIRARRPEIPPVVMVLASGSDGAPAGWLKLGHFAAMRWETDPHAPAEPDDTDNVSGRAVGREAMAEVFVGGEGLARGPVAVLGTLLHEATHALAHARGIKDTSRQGRYHNTRFADLARELGLDVAQTAPIGWSHTTVLDATRAAYADTLADLRGALTIYRRTEGVVLTGPDAGDDRDDDPHSGDTARTRRRTPRPPGRASNNGLACTCGCGRRIRVAPSVLTAGPITCALCGAPFTPSQQTNAPGRRPA